MYQQSEPWKRRHIPLLPRKGFDDRPCLHTAQACFATSSLSRSLLRLRPSPLLVLPLLSSCSLPVPCLSPAAAAPPETPQRRKNYTLEAAAEPVVTNCQVVQGGVKLGVLNLCGPPRYGSNLSLGKPFSPLACCPLLMTDANFVESICLYLRLILICCNASFFSSRCLVQTPAPPPPHVSPSILFFATLST